MIYENCHGDYKKNISHDLVTDDILDPDINQNNLSMEDGKQGAGQQCSHRMVVVDPMRNLPTFSGQKTETADKQFDAFVDYLEIQQSNVVDTNVAQIITRFG